ncbi:MAG: cytochrome c3 family protein [Thermodesulfobacteriota bacterium]|nr:cytochrome c3 family protein [Thermodesulfobacteriota bacterium]
MRIRSCQRQYLFTTVLIVLGVLAGVFTHSDVVAYQPATYADSAHGNSLDGVNRSSATCDNWPGGECVPGSCAHCHDTFDPDICGNDLNGLMLFAPRNPTSQTDNFCFQCHCDPSNPDQKQVEMVPNKDYGATFGGGPAMSENIQDAFNFGPPNQSWTTGSSHNLLFVRNWTKTKPPGDWISNDTNACLVCHDPHLSQKNDTVEPTAQGGIMTAIRRPQAPSSGTNQPGNLWGDESGNFELLAEDQVVYQAPYHGDPVNGLFEPARNSTSDGSNLPNFVRFCAYQSCHGVPIPHAATDADPNSIGDPEGRDLRAIDWTSSGSVHGALAGSPKVVGDPPCSYGSLKPPYNDPDANYVLACTDCHEPHGSESAFLLRRVVNGQEVPAIQQWIGTMDSAATWDFCAACHDLNVPCGPHQCDNEPGGFPDCSEFGCGYCHDHSNYL